MHHICVENSYYIFWDILLTLISILCGLLTIWTVTDLGFKNSNLKKNQLKFSSGTNEFHTRYVGTYRGYCLFYLCKIDAFFSEFGKIISIVPSILQDHNILNEAEWHEEISLLVLQWVNLLYLDLLEFSYWIIPKLFKENEFEVMVVNFRICMHLHSLSVIFSIFFAFPQIMQ